MSTTFSRLQGRFSLGAKLVSQCDYQIEPKAFIPTAGHPFPIGGPFSEVWSAPGRLCLYVSQPGETPLYYRSTPREIVWSEHRLHLGPDAPVHKVEPGTVVEWNHGESSPIVHRIEELPNPPIAPPMKRDPIGAYLERLTTAVQQRVATLDHGSIGIAMSGGADSTLIAWILQQLNVPFTPFTACAEPTAPDAQRAIMIAKALQFPAPVLCPASMSNLDDLRVVAALYGGIGRTTRILQQGMSHLAIVRACQSHGINAIFCGHGQDDIMGRFASFYPDQQERLRTAQQNGSPQQISEVWRDIRRESVQSQPQLHEVISLYASIFRRYYIQVRMPYFDHGVLGWVFSQSTGVIPITHLYKPFVQQIMVQLGLEEFFPSNYTSTGFTRGTGFPQDIGFGDLPYYAELKEEFPK
jgi:asparagine synthetase B (glutamine-hydrolysing)